MKVVHIIPSAFEYFDDIRDEAFYLVEDLNRLGVEGEALTLQYGSASLSKTQELAKEIKKAAPSRTYSGTVKLEAMLKSTPDFDVIHWHVPFLGAARKIMAWKRAHATVPLLVTYYRPVAIVDTLSIGIRWYNNYYLPKIFALADLVAIFDPAVMAQRLFSKVKKAITVNFESEFLGLNLAKDDDGRQLSKDQLLASKYLMLYTILHQEVTLKK